MNVKRDCSFIIGLSVILCSASAWAKGHVAAREESPGCAATYKKALERVQAARLREAQDLFASCARLMCGVALRQECAARRLQMQSDIPSVVPLATDEAGEPRVLVEVRVDGELLTSRLDGHALPIDPGKHLFSFGTDDGVFETQRIVIAQGERNRAIHVVLPKEDELGVKRARAVVSPLPRKADARTAVAPAAAPAPPELGRVAAAARADNATLGEKAASPSAAPAVTGTPAHADDAGGAAPTLEKQQDARGTSPLAYVFGTLGVAGVGAFALLTYWGRNDNKMLADCSPTCPDASVLHVRRLYWGADASLGVGIASLALSTYLFATGSSGSATKPTDDEELSLQLAPTPSGATASLAGRF